ncbi:MAG: aminopeptidase, partial [Bacteroidaceae bacterium]|nr:aminopeptidase [Bacteroidaceae bacterium]
MNKQTVITCVMLLGMTTTVSAQGINAELLQRLQSEGRLTQSDRAVRNALSVTDVKSIALNQDNQGEMNTYFSLSVPSRGITDQKSSGRCWLFTGLNVLRSKVINRQGLDHLEFSQIYLFFYDQLEKSNLFLQAIIDTRSRPLDDKTVEWLLKNPLSDGGTFTGVADLISKYGVVPSGVMPENYTANNTSKFTSYVKSKLREDALILRDGQHRAAELQEMKARMLVEIYHLLALGLGEPVTEFTWAPTGSDGNYLHAPRTYTPQLFYREMVGENLTDDYVMLMNDPSRPYWKTFEIEYDRHTYDGHN